MSTKKESMRDFYNQSEYSNIKAIVKNNNTNLRIATFCIVTKVNNKRIDVKPLVAESIQQLDGEKFLGLPIIKNVPYLNTGYNPKVGDFCVCLTLDRSIVGINKGNYENIDFDNEEEVKKIPLLNSNGQVHNISNCIALVGIEL